MSKTKDSQERVSPTAWHTAYLRTFSDIPYSKEIFKEFTRLKRNSGGVCIPEELKATKIAPQLEARYKLVGRLLAKSNTTQVLEVASGLSSRGLDMTRNKEIEYVEVDLPEIMAQKRNIVKEIQGKSSPNLHLITGDALNLNDLESATKYFDRDKPIAVVNEGLMRYLKFDEKTVFARNVHSLLMRFGGIWVTPDITLKQIIQKEDDVSSGKSEKIREITGMDIYDNAFKSVEDAKEFFERLGFDIEIHNFIEVKGMLTSPMKLNITEKDVDEMIKHAVVFVMRPIGLKQS